MVLVTSRVWKTVTWGAVKAEATIASAVRLRTDRTGTRVWRPSGETVPESSHGWSSPGHTAMSLALVSSEASMTSSRVIIPPGPVPGTELKSIPRSRASLRTGGLASTRTLWDDVPPVGEIGRAHV